MLVSEYREIEMYTDEGDYFGEVKDVVLDPDKGKVSGLAFREKENKRDAVPYGRVAAIGDIILLRTGEEEKSVGTEGVEERGEIELGEEL